MMEIGAVVVTYNSEAEIGACLDSALGRVARLVVVDNASGDGTREEVLKRPGVTLISNAENRGFAAGVNHALSALDTPYVLLLNPDAVLLTGVDPLADACRQPGVGAAAGRLVDRRGVPQIGFSVRRFPTPLNLSLEVLGINHLWPGNPVNRRYRCLDLDLEAPGNVEQPAGAFLMFRRDVWQACGGFDEEFRPLWFEDVDFLKRVREAGFSVRYVPGAVARHAGGASAGRIARESREFYWYSNLLRYSFKHFSAAGRLGVWSAVMAGCALRMVLGVFRLTKPGPAAGYGKVIWFACRRLVSGRAGRQAAHLFWRSNRAFEKRA